MMTETVIKKILEEAKKRGGGGSGFAYILNRITRQYQKDENLINLYKEVLNWLDIAVDTNCINALKNLKTSLKKSGLFYSIIITGKMKKTGDYSEALIVHFLDGRDGRLSCGINLKQGWQTIQANEKNFDLITCPKCIDKYLSILQE